MKTISTNISQKPRLMRNEEVLRAVLFCPERYAEMPESNMNEGAQKWVIQRVKKSIPEVAAGSSGSAVNAEM